MNITLNGARGGAAVAGLLSACWLMAACLEEPGVEPSASSSCRWSCADAATPPASPGVAPGPGAGASNGAVASASPTPPGAGATGGGDAGAPARGGPDGAGTTGDVPCEVQAIVQQRCGSCHGAASVGAPIALLTLADWHAPATTDKSKQYHQLAKVRINASSNPMPPPAIAALTPDEKQKLNAWLDQGAPAGSGACTPAQGGAGATVPAVIDVSDLECHKFLAHAPGNKSAKYKVGAAVDRYVNFGFQAPWQGTFYMQVARPVIDNAKALHHWLIYREGVQDGSVKETNGQHAGGELINGWAPGGDPTNLRKHGDLAQELPAGTYSIEIHYNSSDPGAEDASGVEICGKRTPTANVGSLSWLGYAQGGAISYATGICLEASTSWTGTCAPGHQQPIHLAIVRPHLHQAGRHLKAVINGPNGSRVLLDKPFDFNYQVGYDTNEVLMPGETITTTCTYSEPKCAGQSTAQEMCYLYVVAWPKDTLVDHGPEGAFMHGQGTCLGQ